MQRLNSSRYSSIGNEVTMFLETVFQNIDPDWIITSERKGTALLRSYIDKLTDDRHKERMWHKVLSTDALDSPNSPSLETGNILVLDEGIFSGRGIRQTLSILNQRKHVSPTRIKIASFGIHEHFYDNDCLPATPVDFWWLSNLPDYDYRDVREHLIQYFQQKGSLLLDTEHIEVPVRLRCGRLEFFDALCRAGIGVQYSSHGGRLNLTIHNPLLMDEKELLSKMPPNTTIRNVIRKIRVVERAVDKFAIIPIFYPSIKCDVTPDEMSNIDSSLSKQAGSAITNFHLVGIYSALHLLKVIFSCLYDLHLQNKIDIKNPLPGDSDDSLSHLLALFPNLDLLKLHTLINQFINEGLGHRLKDSVKQKQRCEATEGALYDNSLEELQRAILIEVERISEKVPVPMKGASLADLIGRIINKDSKTKDIDQALLSTAIDRLIDEAHLVTDMENMQFDDGVNRYVRVFRIDGEMVLSDVRRLSCIWQARRNEIP